MKFHLYPAPELKTSAISVVIPMASRAMRGKVECIGSGDKTGGPGHGSGLGLPRPRVDHSCSNGAHRWGSSAT